MTSLETLNTEFATNKLSFPLVTHTVDSEAQFDSYRILNSGQGAEHCLDRLDIKMNDQVLRAGDARFLARVVYAIHRPLTQLSNAYSYAHFW
jgi:hypothetical protein